MYVERRAPQKINPAHKPKKCSPLALARSIVRKALAKKLHEFGMPNENSRREK